MIKGSYNIKIITDKRKRYIGQLNVDAKVFCKEVDEDKHLFRKLNAWGIDAQYFNDVLLPDNYSIKISDKKNGIDYYITARDFKKHSQHYHFITDEDNRAQIFCSRVHFATLPREY